MLRWLYVILLAGWAWAQPAPVAQVQSIAGAGNLFYQDPGKPQWYRAYLEMDNYKGQHLKTDAASAATLRFHLGGLANLAKGSEIEIVGDRDIQVVGNTLVVKSGSLWAKVDKQKKDLQVKTAGGVMAIKGTEFVVSVDEQGDTRLSLLDGSVVVYPEGGEAYEAAPGHEILFGRNRQLVAELRSTQELLQRLRGQLGENFFEMRQQLLQTREQMEQTRAQMLSFRKDMLETREQLQKDGDELRESLLNTRESLLESLGQNPKAQRRQGRVQAANRSAGMVTRNARGLPRFRYATAGAREYKILLARGPSFENGLLWAARTSQAEIDYPGDARPLDPGLYRWRVWPLDDQGQPLGQALEGNFQVP